MDKTITRTKAIKDLRKKCREMSCSECIIALECKDGINFSKMSNLELEQLYDSIFEEKVNIVDFIEVTNGYTVDTKLEFTGEDNKKMSERFEADEKKKQADKTNPNYYKNECSLECIEAMLIAFGSDKVYDFCICNAFKYMWRYKNKNGFEDVEQARWYVDKAKELGFDEPEVFNIEFVLEKIESEVLS